VELYFFQLVHVPTRHHLNDQQGHTDLYVVGDVHSVVVKKSDGDFTIGVLEKHERDAGRKRTRKNSVEGSTKRVRKESVATEEENNSTAEPEDSKGVETSAIEVDDNDDVEIKEEDAEIKVEIKEEDPGVNVICLFFNCL